MVQEIKEKKERRSFEFQNQIPKRICFMVNRINAMTLTHYAKNRKERVEFGDKNSEEGCSLREKLCVFVAFVSGCSFDVFHFQQKRESDILKFNKSNDLHFN
jgi:hypothetical protein